MITLLFKNVEKTWRLESENSHHNGVSFSPCGEVNTHWPITCCQFNLTQQQLPKETPVNVTKHTVCIICGLSNIWLNCVYRITSPSSANADWKRVCEAKQLLQVCNKWWGWKPGFCRCVWGVCGFVSFILCFLHMGFRGCGVGREQTFTEVCFVLHLYPLILFLPVNVLFFQSLRLLYSVLLPVGF